MKTKCTSAAATWRIMIMVAVLSAGCSRPAAPPASVVSDMQPSVAVRPSLSSLLDSLRQVTAVVTDDPSGAWSVGGAEPLLRTIGTFGDTAVAPLAGCIGDTTQVRATYKGKPVRMGLMCFAALQMVAYAEVDDSGNWPGALLPEDGAKRLVAAQAAWQDVVRRRVYRLN